MIVGNPRGRAFQRLLAREAGTGGDARAIAVAARRICEHFARQLTPLIGAAGAAAICARSLHLAQQQIPLVVLKTFDQADGPFVRIQKALEQENPAMATQTAVALLTAAVDLLATFIGESLTNRFLEEAWPHDFAGDKFEETT